MTLQPLDSKIEKVKSDLQSLIPQLRNRGLGARSSVLVDAVNLIEEMAEVNGLLSAVEIRLDPHNEEDIELVVDEPQKITDKDGGTYDWIKVVVNPIKEEAEISYQISEEGTPIGYDLIDDPGCITWSDDDFRNFVIGLLNLKENTQAIEVIFS